MYIHVRLPIHILHATKKFNVAKHNIRVHKTHKNHSIINDMNYILLMSFQGKNFSVFWCC